MGTLLNFSLVDIWVEIKKTYYHISPYEKRRASIGFPWFEFHCLADGPNNHTSSLASLGETKRDTNLIYELELKEVPSNPVTD